MSDDTPVNRLPLDPVIGDADRERLLKSTMDAIDAAPPRLTASAAEALDEIVESGWSSTGMPAALAAIGADVGSDHREVIDRTADAIDGAPASHPVAIASHDEHLAGVRPWWVARVGALAASLALAAVLIFPSLRPTASDAIEAGPNLGQPEAPRQGDPSAQDRRGRDSEELREDDVSGPGLLRLP